MIEGRFHLARGRFTLDVEFRVAARGVTGLFGPSGCGKTSFLRCLAGLGPRASGLLRFEDETWQDSGRGVFLPPHQRGVGLVFQHAALFPHMTVARNIRYAIARRPPGTTDPTEEHVVELAGIGHLMDRSPGTLSGGERQRVAIARALAMAPRLFLLDEPVSALDVDSRSVLLPYLQTLCHSLSIPVIYVSHLAREVASVADQVLVMGDGRILRTMPPAEFLAEEEAGDRKNY